MSRKTVEYHLSHIYRTLDIHSRAELTRLFERHGETNATAPAGARPHAAAAP